MTNRDKIIQTAQLWVDTPYHHHARVLGAGVDCAQLVVACALGADLLSEDQAKAIPNYPVQWHLHNHEEKLLEQLDTFGCIPLDNKTSVKAGDIVTFQFGRTTSHLGIMINETQFIHARYDAKRVVINDFNEEWLNRWTYTYEFPGVNNG